MIFNGVKPVKIGSKKMDEKIKGFFVEKYTQQMTPEKEAVNTAMESFSKKIGIVPVVEGKVNPAFARLLSQSKAVARDYFILDNAPETETVATTETVQTTE